MDGFWYTVEVLIAISVLVFFLIAIGGNILSSQEVDLSIRGYELLKGLDEQGILREYVESGDPEGLNSRVALPGFSHSVQICDTSGVCAGVRPQISGSVFVSNYLVAGETSYSPHNVILYIYTT